MYPLTHIYAVQKIFNRNNNLLNLGSIFPDMCLVGISDRRTSHTNGIKLLSFIKNNYPELKDFALGYLTHAESPACLDFYCDGQYHEKDGYAFIQSRPLIENAAIALNITKERAEIRAHNLIEMAIEILLVRKCPDLIEDCENIIEFIKNDQKLNEALGKFFSKTPENIKNAQLKFFNLLEIKNPIPETMAAAFAVSTKIKENVDINQVATANLIEKAMYIIKDEYEDFMDKSIEKIKQESEKW